MRIHTSSRAYSGRRGNFSLKRIDAWLDARPDIFGWSNWAVFRAVITAVAVAAVLVVLLNATGIAHASIAIPTKKCGTQTMTVHVANNSYYNLDNANPAANSTCIIGHPGVATLTINSTDQHEDWGYPNVSSGWEWGVYSKGGGAYFKYPVEEEHDGNPVSTLDVFPHGGLKGNGAWDIWFDTSNSHPGQDNGTEVMIWISHPGVSESSSTKVNIDHTEFYVVIAKAIAHGVTWHRITYVAVHQTTHLNGMHLNPFFTDAIHRHQLSPEWWMTAIDGGTEITHGGDGTVVSLALTGVN
jgi:hypothetical protein